MKAWVGEVAGVVRTNPIMWVTWAGIGVVMVELISLFWVDDARGSDVGLALGFAVCLVLGKFAYDRLRLENEGLKQAIWCFQSQDQGPGVVRQIIDNRELFELLEQSAPDLLVRRGWVAGWFKSRDAYLIRLARLANAGFSSVERELKPGTWDAWMERHSDVGEAPAFGLAAPPQASPDETM